MTIGQQRPFNNYVLLFVYL